VDRGGQLREHRDDALRFDWWRFGLEDAFRTLQCCEDGTFSHGMTRTVSDKTHVMNLISNV
jgi:hypothetical protein